MRLEELLEWVAADDRSWISERRSIRVSEINEAEGFWNLDVRFQLENQRESNHSYSALRPQKVGPRRGTEDCSGEVQDRSAKGPSLRPADYEVPR